MKKGTIIAVIAAALALVLVVWFVVASTKQTAQQTEAEIAQEEATSKEEEQALENQSACPFPPENTVVYCEGQFTPLTVTAGTAVTFTNASDHEVQPMSNKHPEHADNPELNVGTLAPGASKTVTLTKKGDWEIHDHLAPDSKTHIVVE